MPVAGGEKPHGWLNLSSTVGSLPVPKRGGGIRLLLSVDSKNGSALFSSKPQWGVDGGVSPGLNTYVATVATKPFICKGYRCRKNLTADKKPAMLNLILSPVS